MPHDSLPETDPRSALTRRDLLGRCGMGFGLIGLAGVLADDRSLGLVPAARRIAGAHPGRSARWCRSLPSSPARPGRSSTCS